MRAHFEHAMEIIKDFFKKSKELKKSIPGDIELRIMTNQLINYKEIDLDEEEERLYNVIYEAIKGEYFLREDEIDYVRITNALKAVLVDNVCTAHLEHSK